MEEFSLPRRIWRVIYPTLLYLLISTVISVIVLVVHTVILLGSEQYAGEMLDIYHIVELAVQYLTENVLLISLVGYIAALVVFIPMWLKTKVRYPRWNGGRFSVIIALCSAGAAIGINIILSLIITATGLTNKIESYDIVTDFVSSGSLLLQIAAVGLIAPIAEELCFRGVTMNRMSNAKIWLALAVQAVLFGILHLNILQGVYAALIGVFLGFLTISYRNILYALIAHIAFNLFTVLCGAIESNLILNIIVIAAIILAVISIVGLARSKKPEPFNESETAQSALED